MFPGAIVNIICIYYDNDSVYLDVCSPFPPLSNILAGKSLQKLKLLPNEVNLWELMEFLEH